MSPLDTHPPDCDCLGCKGAAHDAQRRARAALDAPTVVPPAAERCPGCRRTLTPLDAGRSCEWCRARALPEGVTCAGCAHFPRCAWLIGRDGRERSCDWAPSRFALPVVPAGEVTRG